MQASLFSRHPVVKDILSTGAFIIAVIAGALFINSFIFQSFNVEGQSMENTLHNGDRLIVNRLPVTIANIHNTSYTPARGDIIVFKNPTFQNGQEQEYIVKRVIAFAGERVDLHNGILTVYNSAHPEGFNPDTSGANAHGDPTSPISGEVDNQTIPKGTLFVSGDNREGAHSFDSRSGLGYIPLYDVVGPVKLRIFPFTSIRGF